MTMPDTLDMSHMAVCDRPLSRETHIRLALNALFRSEHLRLGATRSRTLAEAADHLAAAGMPELAQRCRDEAADGNGSDVAAIEREVEAAFAAEAGQ
jgi:hypothetical protein